MKVKQLLLMLLFAVVCANASASTYDVEVNGIYYILDNYHGTASVARGDSAYKGSIVIPDSIKANGKTYVVTGIWGDLRNKTFGDSKELTSVKFPNTIKNLMDYLFDGCSSLVNVTWPDSITTIPLMCFHGCSSLSSVNLPPTVTSLENNAFEGCTSLGPVLTIPSTVINLGEEVWKGCTGIKTMRFEDSENRIGSGSVWFPPFSGVNPEVLYIGREVLNFPKKNSVKFVEFGPNLKSWGDSKFVSDSTATIVTDILDPSQIESPQFSDYVYSHSTLYVPQGTLEVYKQANGWKEFLNIKEKDGTVNSIKGVSINSRISNVDNSWYTISGERLENIPSQNGLYIHAGKKIVIDK